MHLKVILVNENPDGSGDCTLEYDADAAKLIMQYGIMAMMKEAIANDQKASKVNDAWGDWPFKLRKRK